MGGPKVVDREAITLAFSDREPTGSYYLDKHTAKVFHLLEDYNGAEAEELLWQIEADGGNRYLQVPKLSLEEEIAEQDAFLESLDDDTELKSRLSQVLENDHDGSRFREFVSRNRACRLKWEAFVRLQSVDRAVKWLDSLGFTQSET